MGRTDCTDPQCLYSTAITLQPLWPYSLYRPSVSAQYSYTSTPPLVRTACTDSQYLYSTAIPLLPLWAVQPLQSLSACTVHLNLYSPYRPHGLYRTSVPVQYSYTSIPPMGRTACTEPQCLYNTAITLRPLRAVRPLQTLSACKLQLHLYSLYRPHGLYRPSVPVQYSYTSIPPMGRTDCTEPQFLYSTAILLLPLWAVRPVQSLSACTVQLYLHSPYGPYRLYRPSVPVQYSFITPPPIGRKACTEPQCLYSTAIPLLPLWAVQPVQTFSICTVQLYFYFPYGPYGLYRPSVPVQYSYISTPPMCRTACTDPQCLYSTATPLLPL